MISVRRKPAQILIILSRTLATAELKIARVDCWPFVYSRALLIACHGNKEAAVGV